MGINLNQFINTFFEEAREHLESIEKNIISLDADNVDTEILNNIFRAAHSIKGASATFGFKQLSESTHELETLFDSLRKGEKKPDRQIVELLLKACDIFNIHLNKLRSGEKSHDKALENLYQEILDFKNNDNLNINLTQNTKKEIKKISKSNQKTKAKNNPNKDNLKSKKASSKNSGVILSNNNTGNKPSDKQNLSNKQNNEKYGFFDEPINNQDNQTTSQGLLNTSEHKNEKYGFFDEPVNNSHQNQETKKELSISAQSAQNDDDHEKNKQEIINKIEHSSIRVSVDKIDRIVNLVGELVIAQAMLQQTTNNETIQNSERLNHSMGVLERNARELQQAVMSIRMVPVSFVFNRFPRLAYDLSNKLNKKVQLKMLGQETELDKEMIELLIDPLTHIIRNAIDHGIESPEARQNLGKNMLGTIIMRATHRGGNIIIEVSDDGAGLNREKIINKAKELNMAIDENAPDNQIWNLIFEPNFSTAQEVTQLSGRGVGMDVARKNINSLGGNISVFSQSGQGTTIRIQLPLTLAVLDGMVINVADEKYIVPLEFVSEAFKPTPNDIKTVTGKPVMVVVRKEYLPLVNLQEVVLSANQCKSSEPLCLVVEMDGQKTALLMDSLIGQQQVVVKSLDTNFHSVKGISGATILGDGRVALILDVSSIIKKGLSKKIN